MVIKFYFHPQSPPSQIVWMVLKELGLDFEPIPVNLHTSDPTDPAFLAVNPRRKVPAIRDGDFTLSESRAIAIYLCQQYEPKQKKNKLYPDDVKKAARMNMEIFANIDCNIDVDKYLNKDEVWSGAAAGPSAEHLAKAKSALEQLERMLQEQDYLAGDHLTIMDFCATFTVEMMEISGFNVWADGYPCLVEWKKRMEALPYFEECHNVPVRTNKQFYDTKVAEFAKKTDC